MANHKSAKKRIRQTARRTAINRARKIRIKSFLKNVEAAIVSGDKIKARQALQQAQPELMRGASKGAYNKQAASRKMRRLSARIKAMAV